MQQWLGDVSLSIVLSSSMADAEHAVALAGTGSGPERRRA